MYCFLIGHQISDLPPDWSTLPGVTAVVSALPAPDSQSVQSGRSGHTCREGQQSLLQTHSAAVLGLAWDNMEQQPAALQSVKLSRPERAERFV